MLYVLLCSHDKEFFIISLNWSTTKELLDMVYAVMKMAVTVRQCFANLYSFAYLCCCNMYMYTVDS